MVSPKAVSNYRRRVGRAIKTRVTYSPGKGAESKEESSLGGSCRVTVYHVSRVDYLLRYLRYIYIINHQETPFGVGLRGSGRDQPGRITEFKVSNTVTSSFFGRILSQYGSVVL